MQRSLASPFASGFCSSVSRRLSEPSLLDRRQRWATHVGAPGGLEGGLGGRPYSTPLVHKRNALFVFEAVNRSSITCWFLTTINTACPADAQKDRAVVSGTSKHATWRPGEKTPAPKASPRPARGGDCGEGPEPPAHGQGLWLPELSCLSLKRNSPSPRVLTRLSSSHGHGWQRAASSRSLS